MTKKVDLWGFYFNILDLQALLLHIQTQTIKKKSDPESSI